MIVICFHDTNVSRTDFMIVDSRLNYTHMISYFRSYYNRIDIFLCLYSTKRECSSLL